MPEVIFKFKPRDRVVTVLGDIAIIDLCAYMGDGIPNRYYVLLAGGNGSWFDEDQLTLDS